MQIPPEPRRAALYLDFDNVFSTLAGLDEAVAWHFASDPGRWLAALAAGLGGDRPRRLLVRRCYLNPAGWTEPEPGGPLASWLGQPRLYFSRFRADFTRAGFEVVDCPRLARLKNGADIQMALDIADALHHPTRFEEFLILSGDSDFTPLLHRLRAHDRLSLLAAQGVSAQALRAAADAVIPLVDLAETALPEDRAAPAEPPKLEAGAAAPPPDPAEPAAQRAAILALLRQEVAGAPGPLHLPALGKRIHLALGGWVRASRFGGAGTLAKLLEGRRIWRWRLGRAAAGCMTRSGTTVLAQPARTTAGRSAGGGAGGVAAGVAGLAGIAPPWRRGAGIALHGLAGLLPLPGPPEPAQAEALAAEAGATGLDLPARAVVALVAWLQRARLDWRQPPEPEAAARLGRAFYAELTRAAAAAGLRLPETALALLRDWVGLATRREAAVEA
ncbi:NYN domain-containing protein [Siccirubricoccus deserti]